MPRYRNLNILHWNTKQGAELASQVLNKVGKENYKETETELVVDWH